MKSLVGGVLVNPTEGFSRAPRKFYVGILVEFTEDFSRGSARVLGCGSSGVY